MMEAWRDIPGYEGLYQVNRQGLVRSLPRATTSGKVLKQQSDKDGYKKVCLCKEHRKQVVSVHRIVATAFIPNDCGFPVVNHKDQNKANNAVDNLEWCTVQYNTIYGDAPKRRSEAKRVPICQYSKAGDLIRVWSGRCEIAETLGFAGGNITSCCTGHRKSANGFLWRYAREELV